MKVGIFFGGPSREREISFAGGRTVYDNLDKALFEPVPIFVDSFGNFILLKWQYLYKGSIRDFYPPRGLTPASSFSPYLESLGALEEAQLAQFIGRIGQHIFPDQFSKLFDIAFLALHGPHGEDGSIQGLLEWYQIPYTGTGVLGAALGVDKVVQKRFMQQAGFSVPRYKVLSKRAWQAEKTKETLFEDSISWVGLPMVVKSPCQGSSIGVSLVEGHTVDQFITAVNRSLFIQEISASTWQSLTTAAKQQWITSFIDLREGIGLPVATGGRVVDHPDALLQYLDHHFSTSSAPVQLESLQSEESVLLEAYVVGREFSCIVLEEIPGQPIALPPTEILKGDVHFDYRAKYLPGIVRKETPMQLPLVQLHAIRKACTDLFQTLGFKIYARIDGFFTPSHQIYLNDPNTTAGMNPSSFLFHQAAEIGLSPTQLLTFLIRTSLATRQYMYKARAHITQLLQSIDQDKTTYDQDRVSKLRVGVIMGGFSAERHISVESGRNIFQKLTSSTQYIPIPLFLSGTPEQHRLFVLPINMLLKDNADDIHERLLHLASDQQQDLMASIRKEAVTIIEQYAGAQIWQPEELDYSMLSQRIDFAFIALHGRPGEDGTLQALLTQLDIPYNGSGICSTQLTIDKFKTNQLLRSQGMHVAEQALMSQATWAQDATAAMLTLESQFGYPFIAKPVDEGCSAAVIKIQNRAMLVAYAAATFRTTAGLCDTHAQTLGIQSHAEFPQKSCFLVEALIEQQDAIHFLEITGGLLTHLDAQGHRTYEIFSPSEVLATGEILSLEEKFLSGEGQNITPARFHPDPTINQQVEEKVMQDLKSVAQLLDLEGYARIDAFVKIYSPHHVETWIIEVNALPGMTPATCIFHQCALRGYTPLAFIDKIIQYGLQKHTTK
ncbi:MAG: D-alanine--D-alanine ligase [Amoebophilaceae bacterium]|jgi:D-alanine-D-alanine ligase|nr:D-alanine--D-alanine ligase [Amoebophilaceae bacterium]